MRLQSLVVIAQVVVCLLLLTVGLVTIVTLEDADSTDGADPRIGGAIGFVAVVTGIAIFAVLLAGAWTQRTVVAPLSSLEAAVSAIARGHVQRRVNETNALGEVVGLAHDVNEITDRLRQLERAHANDELLARAALESLFDAQEVAGAVLDPTGRLIASNARVRTALEAGGHDPAALLGRDPVNEIQAQLDEVRDGGVLRGYVARLP
ncbi:MAG: hypothetical protein CMJ83_04340 [Planctomycetes bacterium]|nr:hypothetical protein [Planctomycetota bacterium]